MSRNYDNWEWLVDEVLLREELRQLAYLEDSSSTSIISSTSSSFNSLCNLAANFDWDRLPPIDYQHTMSSWLPYLSFSLDKESGKKCFMVGARDIQICWGHNPEYWEWTSDSNSRFPEVAQLKRVCWLDIIGRISTLMLSSNTCYGVYLVFKLANRFEGLEYANAVVRLVNDEAEEDAKNRASTVHLQQANATTYGSQEQTRLFPVRRSDGWLEIEMGEFYKDERDDDDDDDGDDDDKGAEARLVEVKRGNWKTGLVVEGIEFRPKTQFASWENDDNSSIYGSQGRTGGFPVRESDSDKGDDGDAEARLTEMDHLHGTSGLVDEGIEFQTRTRIASWENDEKKELYFSPCHSPILLDGRKLSFFLEEGSGKKCCMVGARELQIFGGDVPMKWEWTSRAYSRFSEVAQLKCDRWLDIRGQIKTEMLSPNTYYVAYMVFKLAEIFRGLEFVNAVVRLVNNEADEDATRRASTVHLHRENANNTQQNGRFPMRRSDGWMEIRMGSFYNNKGDDGEAEARLMEVVRGIPKAGLVVEGIEFRPKTQFWKRRKETSLTWG